MEFEGFLQEYENKIIPLDKECNIAAFDASITGKDEDYKKCAELQLKIAKIYSSKDDFEKIKEFRDSGKVAEPLLKRQLDRLYEAYLGCQIDDKTLEELINTQNLIEQEFSTYRAVVGGKEITDNGIEEILSNSKNSQECKDVWLASKTVGKQVAGDVLTLVKMRNSAAQELGFNNYHEMQLMLSEQDPTEIERIFDELYVETEAAYSKVKGEIDDALASKFSITKADLRPWHYGNRFFQQVPKVYSLDLDAYYKSEDSVELTKKYYEGISLPIDHIVARSDLYEKEGKNQHAYCMDIDRNGDIRVLANVKQDKYWMDTLLHEFGHAVYDDKLDGKLPYLLRSPSHTFTTEAIAMMFGRMVYFSDWYEKAMGVDAKEAKKIEDVGPKYLKANELIFSRWAQVMYRFEKGMYENPDRDLNKLWWDVVEKYQKVARPEGRDEPDWASKIHIATVPAYYHNYMLGSMLASQMSYHIADKIIGDGKVNQSFYGRKEVGDYLANEFFGPGDRFKWDELIEKSTGEKLTAKYFAKQFT